MGQVSGNAAKASRELTASSTSCIKTDFCNQPYAKSARHSYPKSLHALGLPKKGKKTKLGEQSFHLC